jgi:hypothetical protein
MLNSRYSELQRKTNELIRISLPSGIRHTLVGSVRGGWWWFDFLCDVEEEMSNEQGFRGIPGVPEGWELVRIGVVVAGEYRLLIDRSVEAWEGPHPSTGWAVVLRKIEKPKQYRQFANAEEFKPHRDRWWRWKEDPNDFNPPCCYSDKFHGAHGWSDSFNEKVFDDGSHFGVEVTE